MSALLSAVNAVGSRTAVLWSSRRASAHLLKPRRDRRLGWKVAAFSTSSISSASSAPVGTSMGTFENYEIRRAREMQASWHGGAPFILPTSRSTSEDDAAAWTSPAGQLPLAGFESLEHGEQRRRELRRALQNPSDALGWVKHMIATAYSSNAVDMETVLTRPTTLGSLEVPEAARQQARETIQALPPTTFSELLRCLDPVTSISKWVEPSDGLYVDRAAMERTTLGGEFEAYGIRKIYGDLIVCVMGLVSLRWKAGHRPTVEDFHVLLRCAGAASQLSKAKKIWHMMEDAGLAGQRNGRSYAEFAKARFLTEPLYTQYDKSRCRVRPIDLANVKSGMSLSRRALRTLRLMRYKEMESQTHGAGMVPFGAGMRRITRSLRWPVPVKKMWATMMRGDLVLDESNVCAAIVALGRAGSLQFMEREILWRLYLIRVERPGSGNVVVKGGRVEMQAHSPLRPTVKLLEAIVEAYCSNAEVARGLKVVDLLSRRYAIPMPAKLWFDVLEWAYVQASLPASQEWRVAGWPGKSLNQDSVQMIWDTMTQAPYNVEPGFRQYQILVNMLLSRNRLRQAMAYMLDLEPFYRSLLPELEDAFGTEAEARALGVATQTAASVRAGAMGWDAQRARKDLVFSIFQGWVHALLRRVRGRHPAGDALTTVLVPQLVAAFRAVLPPTVAYRVATGKVEMANAASVRHRVRYVLERRRRPLTVKGDAVSPSFFRHDRFGKRRMAEQWLKVVHVPRLVTRPLDPGALLRRAPRPLDLERQFT